MASKAVLGDPDLTWIELVLRLAATDSKAWSITIYDLAFGILDMLAVDCTFCVGESATFFHSMLLLGRPHPPVCLQNYQNSFLSIIPPKQTTLPTRVWRDC